MKMKETGMVIVLLVGVVCLLVGGGLLMQKKVIDPFQAGMTSYTLPAEDVALEDMTVARVRIDGGSTDDSYLNIQKIRLIAFNGSDIWQTVTATGSPPAPGDIPNNVINPNTTGYYHSLLPRNQFLEFTVNPPMKLDRIEITNRTNCCQDRLASYTLRVFDTRGDEFFTQALSAAVTQVYSMPAYRFPPGCTPVGGRDLRCRYTNTCRVGDTLLSGGVCRPVSNPYTQLTYPRPTYKRMTFQYPPYAQKKTNKETAPITTPKVKRIRILPTSFNGRQGTTYDGNIPLLNLSYIFVRDIYGNEIRAARTYSRYDYSPAELAEIAGSTDNVINSEVCNRNGRLYTGGINPASRVTGALNLGTNASCWRPNDADMVIETSTPGWYQGDWAHSGIALNDGRPGVKSFPNDWIFMTKNSTHTSRGLRGNSNNPFLTITFTVPRWIESIDIYNRGDCCQDRLQYFRVVFENEAGGELFSRQLTSAAVQNINPGFNRACPAGFVAVEGGDITTCYKPCPAGHTENTSKRTECLVDCVAPLETLQSGQCVPNTPSGFTKNGNTFTKNCDSGDTAAADGVTCIKPCKTGETQTASTCSLQCAAGFRHIPTNENQCFPTDGTRYIPTTWQGWIRPYVGGTSWCVHPMNQEKYASAAVTPNGCNQGNTEDFGYMLGTPSGQIINNWSRMCLDANPSAAQPVFWPCHGGPNQQWQIDDRNRIRTAFKGFVDPARNATDQCLTMSGLANGTISANSPLTLQPCGSCADAQQVFNFPHRQVAFFTNPPAKEKELGVPVGPPAKEGFQALSSTDPEEEDAAFREPAATIRAVPPSA